MFSYRCFYHRQTHFTKSSGEPFSSNAGYQIRVVVEKFGKLRLREITNFEIEKWLVSLRGRYTNTTINHFIVRLNAIFSQAVVAGYVEAENNPMQLVAKLEEKPRTKRRLSHEEEKKILTACYELGFEHTATTAIILVETGMRPMEFFEMRRDQVNLAAGLITPISYKRGRRRQGTAQPKERIVPLTDRARAEFEKLLASPKLASGDRIFPYKSIRRSWEAVCEKAEVGEFWLRWLRDEASSRWADQGMDPFAIAQLLGHSSPRTSMIYVKRWRDQLLRAMQPCAIVPSLSQVAAAKVAAGGAK